MLEKEGGPQHFLVNFMVTVAKITTNSVYEQR